MIEDDPREAELVRDLLSGVRGMAFDVTYEERLKPGVERLTRDGADVVLLDFKLPDGSGLAAFNQVRAAAPTVPVIIVTNMEDETLAIEAVGQGAQDYLLKRDLDTGLLGRAIRYAMERARAERALRESEERFSLAVRGANDGLWDWDLAGQTIYFAPRWARILNHEPDEIQPRVDEWFERVHPDDAPGFRDALDEHLAGKTRHFSYEYRIRTKHNGWVWVLSRGLAVRDESGRPTRMAGSLTDISARKRAEEQLRYDAVHDTLTGLPNRTLFLDRLGLLLQRYRRNRDAGFAVLCFDVDRFKNVNDSLGHEAGDALLCRIAERFGTLLRSGDTLARLGGDEFAILLSDVTDLVEAIHVGERARGLLEETFRVNGNEVFTSASVGIAGSDRAYERPEEILRDAEIAMYRAKARGASTCEVFDPHMHRRVVALLQLEQDLRRAIMNKEFIVHYQPIVSVCNRRITGFEALVRWKRPGRGLVPPESFIGVAEETGLMAPIGWWVLEEACRQTRRWQDVYVMDPPIGVSVNVSGKLFVEDDMVGRVIAVLEKTGLPPECLRLEITENVIMNHGDGAIGKLAELRALGVQLHIDDFGTGYSSLSYLQSFRYDSLKIDRSFVRGLGGAGNGEAIVQTLVALGDLLEMNVIAEGVETAEQFRQLHAMSCPQAQGYWIARPMDGVQADRILAEGPVWNA